MSNFKENNIALQSASAILPLVSTYFAVVVPFGLINYFLINSLVLLTRRLTSGERDHEGHEQGYFGLSACVPGLGMLITLLTSPVYKVNDSYNHVRDLFTKGVSVHVKEKIKQNAPHPGAASWRRSGLLRILNGLTFSGLTPFFYQLSAPNHNAGEAGNIRRLTVKDYKHQENKSDVPLSNHAIVYVDDDYYTDYQEELLKHPNNVHVLYTAVPRYAAYMNKDVSMCFNEQGNMVYHSSGSARYEHKIYDFSSDNLLVKKSFLQTLWATVTAKRDEDYVQQAGFIVERYQTDDLHDIILLIPQVSLTLWGSIKQTILRFAYDKVISYFRRDMFLESHLNLLGEELRVFNPIVTGIKRKHVNFRVATERGLEVSVGIPNHYFSVNVPEPEYTRMSATVMAAEVKPNQFTMAGQGAEKEACALLTEFFRDSIECKDKIVSWRPILPYSYEVDVGDRKKPLVQPYIRPLIAGVTTTPMKEQGTVITAVEKRMKFDVKKKMSSFMLKSVKEFCEAVSEETGITKGSLVPASVEEILSHVKNSRQARIMDESSDFLMHGRTTGFPKAESYPYEEKDGEFNPKDPRVIVSFSGSAKYRVGKYVYAIQRVLKRCSWYAFVAPNLLKERLMNMINKLPSGTFIICEGDGKRFDGHVNELARILVLHFWLFFFAQEEHKEICEVMSDDAFCKVIMEFSVWFFLEAKRGSGSMSTSSDNSILSAFMRFYGLKLEGETTAQSYALIGLIGGDDTIYIDRISGNNEQFYKRAAEDVGQEMQIVKPTCPGFLGRLYPCLVAGVTDSCTDPKRFFKSFHVTTGEVEPERKLYEKALSLYLTDPHTPILGQYVSKVVLLAKGRLPERSEAIDELTRAYSSQTGLSSSIYHAVTYGDFNLQNECLPEFHDIWDNYLGTCSFELSRFLDDLDKVRSISDMLELGPYGEFPQAVDATLPYAKVGNIEPTVDRRQVANADGTTKRRMGRFQVTGEDISVMMPKVTPARQSKSEQNMSYNLENEDELHTSRMNMYEPMFIIDPRGVPKDKEEITTPRTIPDVMAAKGLTELCYGKAPAGSLPDSAFWLKRLMSLRSLAEAGVDLENTFTKEGVSLADMKRELVAKLSDYINESKN